MANTIKTFGEIYKSVYDNPGQYKDIILSESQIFSKSASIGLGHPNFDDIEIGETVLGSLIVFFMDIRGFTKLSIALENDELIRILQAITVASIISIRQYNGHVAEFTGDGVMAYFGEGYTTNTRDAFNALRATSFLMQGIKEAVNKYLDRSGDETVKVGMGIEYGNVLWTKIGLPDTNQVKPISEVSFIAGKNSSQSSSWQAIMGKNISEWVPDIYKKKYDSYSFQKDNVQYDYERYTLNWEKFFKHFCETPTELERLLLSKKLPAIQPIIASSDNSFSTPTTQQSGGPRPLKDQPFFNVVK